VRHLITLLALLAVACSGSATRLDSVVYQIGGSDQDALVQAQAGLTVEGVPVVVAMTLSTSRGIAEVCFKWDYFPVICHEIELVDLSGFLSSGGTWIGGSGDPPGENLTGSDGPPDGVVREPVE
jgi:hypothetical protein